MSPDRSWNLRIQTGLVLVLLTINTESLSLNRVATKSDQDLNEFTINKDVDVNTEKYLGETISVTDYSHTNNDNVTQPRSEEGNFNSNVNIQSLNTGDMDNKFSATPFEPERTIGIDMEYSIKNFTNKSESPLKGIEMRNSQDSLEELSTNINSSTNSYSEVSSISISYMNTEFTTLQMKPDLTASSTNTFSTLLNSHSEPIGEPNTDQDNEKTTSNDLVEIETETELITTTNSPPWKRYKTIHRKSHDGISFGKAKALFSNEQLERTTNIVYTETGATSVYAENSNSVVFTTMRPSTSTSSISSTGGESSDDHKDVQRNDHNPSNQIDDKLEEREEKFVQPQKKNQTQALLDNATIKNQILTETIFLENEANMRYIKENSNDSKEYTSTRDIRFVTKATYDTLNDIRPSDNTAADTGAANDGGTYLKVEPLGQETKEKNHSLYKVNPNYKRFKKIEIMPPKSFKRDPNDNSWRNESISSLGIVFKANNSSKSLTLGLKNKTDADLSMFLALDKDNKTEPELRARLEKLSELRKSKKKRPNDHEPPQSQDISTSLPPDTTDSTDATTSYDLDKNNHSFIENIYNTSINGSSKYYNFVDYYDSTDLSEKDLTTWPSWTQNENTPDDPPTPPRPLYAPDRRATLQYFPPRTTSKPEQFTKYAKTMDESPTQTTSVSTVARTKDPTWHQHEAERPTYKSRDRESPGFSVVYRDDDRGRDSYVVKHYEEFLAPTLQKYEPYPEDEDIPPQTPHPPRQLTAHQLTEQHFGPEDDYDYENVQKTMREQMNRYIERLRAELPVVYSSNVVHQSRAGRVRAASSAYLRRLYEAALAHEPQHAPDPAYELHYYLPDQEEAVARRS